MAQFSVNSQRFDPYKNFKFRVKWDGRYVAGVSKVSMLKRTTEVVKHREGGDPSTSRKSPGRTEFDAITLERVRIGALQRSLPAPHRFLEAGHDAEGGMQRQVAADLRGFEAALHEQQGRGVSAGRAYSANTLRARLRSGSNGVYEMSACNRRCTRLDSNRQSAQGAEKSTTERSPAVTCTCRVCSTGLPSCTQRARNS